MAPTQYYVTWNGNTWLAKDKAFFERSKAQDLEHGRPWWDEWVLLTGTFKDADAAIARAKKFYGSKGAKFNSVALQRKGSK